MEWSKCLVNQDGKVVGNMLCSSCLDFCCSFINQQSQHFSNKDKVTLVGKVFISESQTFLACFKGYGLRKI